MIINTFNTNVIKILIDEFDLKTAGISPENWITNSNQTIFYINNLLKFTTNLNTELVLNDYYIFTNNYKVFSIILIIK